MKTSVIVMRQDGTEYPTEGEPVYADMGGREQAAWTLDDGSLVSDTDVRHADPLEDPESWTKAMWDHFHAIGGFKLGPERAREEMAKEFGPGSANDTEEGD